MNEQKIKPGVKKGSRKKISQLSLKDSAIRMRRMERRGEYEIVDKVALGFIKSKATRTKDQLINYLAILQSKSELKEKVQDSIELMGYSNFVKEICLQLGIKE